MAEDELRRFVRRMFGRDDEPGAPGANVVPTEGRNPPVTISGQEHARDFIRRFFDTDYAATEVPLPEETRQ